MNYSSSIQSLWTEAKNYLELQKEYLKLDSAEKLSVLLSAVATAAVCIILALAALFFFVIALAFWLAKIVGGAWSFTIMGGAMLLIIIVVLLARKRWIVQPITRFVAGLLIADDETEEDPS
ncbi:MAG: phage holin family protein [Bacteroidaceae bacterium]|nr:phage holin family protein [Lachnospiraceae bacterium]MBQ8454201.1 phage holin family protein [Bacteroidaceae bacterium]MBQ9170289.1 phage holin family protein [Bacteroidaceae bacterium]